jgi:hypothetical protein
MAGGEPHSPQGILLDLNHILDIELNPFRLRIELEILGINSTLDQ